MEIRSLYRNVNTLKKLLKNLIKTIKNHQVVKEGIMNVCRKIYSIISSSILIFTIIYFCKKKHNGDLKIVIEICTYL